MEDIHLPSKRKFEGDESSAPMKRGRDGIISQHSSSNDHDVIKRSTLVAIQNSIVLVKKLFRDLHALVTNLFAVGSDGYLTLFFLHLYRDVVLAYNVELATSDRLRKSCASGYIFEIFSFFWPEEKMQSLLPFHNAFKCGLALELGYILAVACREMESTFDTLRSADLSDDDLSPAEEAFVESIAHSGSGDHLEVLLARSRVFTKLNGGSLQSSGSNFKKRVLQTAPFVCKRYEEFNFVEIHSILRGEQLCCINEQYLSDFQPLIDYLVERSVTVQSPETAAEDDTAMHCDPEPIVSRQPTPTIEASDVALIFNIASVKSRLPEIEAAIKAYPFRQPRDEKAALEGMSAIVRDMENGNIKSREDLHKRCMRFNTSLPGDCLPVRGLIYRVFDFQAGRLGASLGQAAHGFKIKPVLEATDSMRPSMLSYHQRGGRGTAVTGKQASAFAQNRSTQQQAKIVSKTNGTNGHVHNGTAKDAPAVPSTIAARVDPKPQAVAKKPTTIAIDTNVPTNNKEVTDEASVAGDGNKDSATAATSLSAISPKTPTAAPVPLSAMNFTQMATHFNSSLTNEQKLAYWHSAVRLISSSLTPAQTSAIKDALSLQSTGDRFNTELLAAKWGITVDEFQGVLKRVKSARSRVLHDKVRQLINAGSYPVPRDFSTWKKALDTADAKSAQSSQHPTTAQLATAATAEATAAAAPTAVTLKVSDEKSSTDAVNRSTSSDSLSSASLPHPVGVPTTLPTPPPPPPSTGPTPASSTTTEKADVVNVASKSSETVAVAAVPVSSAVTVTVPGAVTSPPKECPPLDATNTPVPSVATMKSPEVVIASSNGHPTPDAHVLNTSISPTVPKQPITPTTPTTPGPTSAATGAGVGASTDGMISVRLVYEGSETRRETAKVKPTKRLSTFIESLRKHRNLVGTVQLWRDTQLLSGSDSLQVIGVREGDVLTVRVVPPPPEVP